MAFNWTLLTQMYTSVIGGLVMFHSVITLAPAQNMAWDILLKYVES